MPSLRIAVTFCELIVCLLRLSFFAISPIDIPET